MAERETRKQSVGERAARLLAVPADGVAGVPRAELIGDNEVFLEHYRGILAYGKEEIHVDGGGWVLRILGRNLEIKAMRAGELRIFGGGPSRPRGGRGRGHENVAGLALWLCHRPYGRQ